MPVPWEDEHIGVSEVGVKRAQGLPLDYQGLNPGSAFASNYVTAATYLASLSLSFYTCKM